MHSIQSYNTQVCTIKNYATFGNVFFSYFHGQNKCKINSLGVNLTPTETLQNQKCPPVVQTVTSVVNYLTLKTV